MELHSVDWTPYLGHDWAMVYDSTVPMDHLKALGERISQYQPPMCCNVRSRRSTKTALMAAGEKLVDWGFAETLAYATLVDKGIHSLHRGRLRPRYLLPSPRRACTVRPMPAPTPRCATCTTGRSVRSVRLRADRERGAGV